MGCKLSQLVSSELSNGVDPLHRPPPPADPRSPLTTKQQYCMLASWKGIFRQIEKTGIILFVKNTGSSSMQRFVVATMGCKLCQLVSSELSNGVDPLHRPPPPADPRSPLTTKQQYCMLASWKGIFRQIEKTGIILFVKLFEENEDLIHLFENFRELRTKEAQISSAELAEHATKVMHTLDEGIKGLADMDNFFSYVRHIGATHRQVPGFEAENFMKIEQPFLEAAKTTLGDRYTPNIENIYKLTIRFILENLVKGYEEAGMENGTKET